MLVLVILVLVPGASENFNAVAKALAWLCFILPFKLLFLPFRLAYRVLEFLMPGIEKLTDKMANWNARSDARWDAKRRARLERVRNYYNQMDPNGRRARHFNATLY